MDTSNYFKKCNRNYLLRIRNKAYNKPYSISNNLVGKLYEYLWAIKLGMVLWEDIPLNWEGLPSRDMGIDLVNQSRDKVVQCKCFRKDATIKFTK